MSLSRLQLAAALLEYDNLDAPPTRPPVSHRDSALFRPYKQRPLDAIPISHQSQHDTLHYPSHQQSYPPTSPRRDSIGGYLPGAHPHDAPLRRARPESTIDPSAPLSPPLAENVDLGRWGLPDHLLSPTTEQPTSSQGGRPFSGITEAGPSRRDLPLLRTSTVPIRPLAVSSPLSDRINSVHLDVMDGMAPSFSASSQGVESTAGVGRMEQGAKEGGRDAYDEANEAIARARRVQTMYDDTPRARTRSGTSNGWTGAEGVPLPVSPASTVMSFRPASAASGDLLRKGSRDYLGEQGAGRPGTSTSRSSYDMLYGGVGEGPVRPGTSMSRNSVDGYRPTSMMDRRHSTSMSLLNGGRMYDEPNGNYRQEEEEEEEEVLSPNPFALPPPPMEAGSRFDPKVLEAQRKSIDLTRPLSRLSISSQDRLSRFHPNPIDQAHAPAGSALTEEHLQQYLTGGRRPSHPLEQLDPMAGRDIQHFDEIPSAAEYGKPLRAPKYGPPKFVDRRSLLRPKTLIMPSLLTDAPPPKSPPRHVPDGYTLGAKPLPAGARSSILSTTDLRAQSGGRGGIPLSLSQKTFRSSLMVGGKREEEEYWVGGATEEGDVGVEYVGDVEYEGPVDRRPGKLYGKSLMDQLEARKAAMKGKQRAFTGDARPAMMARQPEPNENVPEQGITRSNTIKTRQPLLKIDSSGEIDLNPLNPNISPVKSTDQPATGPYGGTTHDRITKSRSVFGVDTIWEKEMAKLKVIQEAEERAKARREAEEALEGKKKEKKKSKDKDKDRRKSKRKSAVPDVIEMGDQSGRDFSPVPIVNDLPPQISYSPEKAPKPQVVDPITDEVKDIKDVPDLDLTNEREGRLRDGDYGDEKEWSGDEETPLKLDKGKQRAHRQEVSQSPTRSMRREVAIPTEESDSEEDVPLSRMIKPTRQAQPQPPPAPPVEESDSEEDVPLAKLKPPSPSTSLRLPTSTPGFGTGSLGLETHAPIGPLGRNGDGESDEDDVPLMLRKSTVRPLSTANGPAMDPEVEDDLPLGFKHADAVVRKNAESWRNNMASPVHSGSQYGMPQMGMGNMPQMGHMSMPPMMPNGYPGWGYPGMPNMGMGYPAPSMNMAGWNGVPMSQGGMPYMPGGGMGGPGGMGMGMGDFAPAPPVASHNIDSWRKEVAVQPVATGGGGSSVRTSGSTR